MTAQEQRGFELFGNNTVNKEGPARCSNCHGGPETTDASIFKVERSIATTGVLGGVGPIRRRQINIVDLGFNNIGVTPTLEDLGVGGNDPFGKPLSVARQEALLLLEGTSKPTIRIPDPVNPGQTIPFVKSSDVMGSDGAFKIPMLRNVELTAPYFHNGDAKTLSEVVEFYFRGGNHQSGPIGLKAPATSNPSLIPPGTLLATGGFVGFDATRTNQVIIRPVGTLTGPNFDNTPAQNLTGPLVEEDKKAIVALLLSMTDDRVKFRKAPFDHPELFVPNGHIGDESSVINFFGTALDQFERIPAVGKNGGDQLPKFLGLDQQP